jgi:MFS family permease
MVSTAMTDRERARIEPLKVVFALAYVMQGLANPFLGITTQSFFRHLHMGYGLSEGDTQRLFAKSYLAWSFKPIIGFMIDAYGRTRAVLIALLGLAALGYLLTPLVDVRAMVFFGMMFAVSVVLAGTDVAVDRATIIAGDEQAKATGQSRAAAVGLNQAICWLSVYGTSILAAVLGGYVAEHVPFKALLVGLAAVPAMVLLFVLRLPKDTNPTIPLKRSIAQFWAGLNSGAVLGVMLFYFLFHFQPQVGPIFIKYMMETLKFSQTQIGIGDGATNAGYFVGVLLFVWKGVAWQERLGLRALFRVYIVLAAVLGLTQFTLLDPWFSGITGVLARGMPFLDPATVRLGFLCLNNFVLAAAISLFRMSTLSLVGAVIPVAAAGSLFAGFMSVANLGYTSSYASGAWLYDHGMSVAPLRAVQQALFGIGGGPADTLSMQMLILIGSVAYFASFIAVHVLPGRGATDAAAGDQPAVGPERWLSLPAGLRRATNWGALVVGAALLAWLTFRWKFDPVASVLITFLGVCLLRKSFLDALLRRSGAGSLSR